MNGLAVKLTNGNTTIYTNTDHVFVGGTNHLCLRTGNAVTDVVSYPLTTNTSASQYSPIRVRINGSNCYLASQSQGQGVAYTLPQATILGQTPGNLLLNTYSEYYFVSNSVSRYSETNSIRQGTLIGQEIVEWPGKYTLSEGAGQGALIDVIDHYTQSKFYSYDLPTNDNTVFAGFLTTSTSSSQIPEAGIQEYVWYVQEAYYDTIPEDPNQDIAYWKGGAGGGYTYFTLNEFTKKDYYKRSPDIYSNIQSGTTTMTVNSYYESTYTSAPLAYNDLYTYYSGTEAIGKRFGRNLNALNGFAQNVNWGVQMYWDRFIYQDTKSLYFTTSLSGELEVLTTAQRNGGAIPLLSNVDASYLNNLDVRGLYYTKQYNTNKSDLGFRTVISITGTYTHLRPEISDHEHLDSREVLETITIIHNSIGAFIQNGDKIRLAHYFNSYTHINENGIYKYPFVRGYSRQSQNYPVVEKILPGNYFIRRRISVSKNTIVVSTYYGSNFGGVEGVPYYEHWTEYEEYFPVEDYEYDEYEGGKEYFATYTEGVYDGAEVYYVPYSYTRYSQYVNKNVPVYSRSTYYDYSITTKYSLQVPGLVNYTSSLPYNTSGVYNEDYGPVFDRQRNTYVITQTSVGYGYDYSTNVLVPYLATIYNQAIEQGDYINIRTTSEYTDQYTNAALAPSGKTFIGSHTEPENKVVQQLRQVVAETGANGTQRGPGYKNYYEYYTNSDRNSGRSTYNAALPSLTSKDEYKKATGYGVNLGGNASSYKSSVGYGNYNGVQVYTGYVITATKSKLYNNQKAATVVYQTNEYLSSAKKAASDTTLRTYDTMVHPTKTAVYWNGYGSPKASDTANWESSLKTNNAWEVINYGEVAHNSKTNNSNSGTKSSSKVNNTYNDIISKLYDPTGYGREGITKNGSSWTVIMTSKSTTPTGATDSEETWPSGYSHSYKTRYTTSVSYVVNWWTIAGGSYKYRGSTSTSRYTSLMHTRSTISNRIYISGNKTRETTRSYIKSGVLYNDYNYSSTYLFDVSSKTFRDAYQYYENVNTVITHTLVTLAGLSQIRSSNTKYTLRTSRVDKDYKYSYLYTYTTSHKYYTSNITNNANV